MLAIPHTIDPRIGVLMRNGMAVFYAFVNGYGREPIEGTLNEVESSLGIALPPMPAPAGGSGQNEAPAHNPGREPKGLRQYAVTITPNVVTYGGSHTHGETVEYVYADTRADAERKVRQELRETNGRHGPKYKVCARLACP